MKRSERRVEERSKRSKRKKKEERRKAKTYLLSNYYKFLLSSKRIED
jgi:hypothetical protein